MKGASRVRNRCPPCPPGRFYRLAYSNITSHSKSYALHQVRDGMAFCELAAMFTERGYRFGTTIHLYEDDPRPLSALPGIGPGDLLVLTTRPPLDDGHVRRPAPGSAQGGPRARGRRKLVPRNGGELEAAYLAALDRYFVHCDRTVITLSDHAASLLDPADAAFRDIELYEYTRDDIHWYRRGPDVRQQAGPPPSTVGFFIHIPKLPGLGCDMVVSFGMSGFTNLVWNRIVRMRHSDWFATRRFVMARLTLGGFRPYPEPMTPEFADRGDVVQLRVLAEERLH